MQQLTLVDVGKAGWTELPTPRIEDPRAALIRPIAAATCDFDHLLFRGAMPFPLPLSLGHEAVGVVQEIGEQVRGISPGDLVVLPFQISCGDCPSCRRGLTSACAAVDWLSCYGLGEPAGGFGGMVADLVLVPYADAMLLPLPPTVTPVSAAAVSCNIVDAYRCVAPQLASNPAADVLVIGGAFANIALYSAQIAVQLGAGRVSFYAEDDSQRLRAEALGFDVLRSIDPKAHQYPITVDASMDPRLLGQAVEATARGGTLTASTMYTDASVRLPLMPMFERCLSFSTGQPHARGLMQPVLDLMEAGVLDLDSVVTAVGDWADAPDAFMAGSGKAVLTRDA